MEHNNCDYVSDNSAANINKVKQQNIIYTQFFAMYSQRICTKMYTVRLAPNIPIHRIYIFGK